MRLVGNCYYGGENNCDGGLFLGGGCDRLALMVGVFPMVIRNAGMCIAYRHCIT